MSDFDKDAYIGNSSREDGSRASAGGGIRAMMPDDAGRCEYIYNFDGGRCLKKPSVGRILLVVILVTAAVAAVSASSIYIYSLAISRPIFESVADGGDGGSDSSDGSGGSLGGAALGSMIGNVSKEDSKDSSEDGAKSAQVPSMEQLAAPEDAMYLPDIYDKVSPSVVGISCTVPLGTTTGTGIVISSDGYIITNAHVLEDAVSVMIIDSGMEEYSAEIIGSDDQTDLAVLKIEAEGLVSCEFGRSEDLRVGELSIVIGNPLGFDLYGSMTTGIISGLNRTLTIGDKRMTLIQTQATINKGNSGGPLINCYGQVIGVTSAKVDSSYGEGLGFAIPIDEAIPIIEDLIAYGYVTGRPMIGVTGEDITSFISLYYRLPEGVFIRFVTPDSGAERAGLMPSDIIIGANGETVTSFKELNELVSDCSVGDTMVITIYRDGFSMDVEVVLGEVTG